MRLSPLFATTVLAVACAQGSSGASPDGPKLEFPLACRIGETCEVQNYVDRDPGPSVKDYRCGARTYDGHKGVDIRVLDMAAQARGVDVLAAAAGRVSRLRDGMADISIRAATAPAISGRECGNGVVIDHGDGWETQYCHLAKGSVRVKVGDGVVAGQPIARVGLSGSTEFPHLHLSVSHRGQVVDPFSGSDAGAGGCVAGASLWSNTAQSAMAYKRGAILNLGFAAAPVSMEAVETGGIATPGKDAPMIVGYGRAIGLERGDKIALTLFGPDGVALAADPGRALDRDKAQVVQFVGKRRPQAGWPADGYRIEIAVVRGAKVVLRGTRSISF